MNLFLKEAIACASAKTFKSGFGLQDMGPKNSPLNKGV